MVVTWGIVVFVAAVLVRLLVLVPNRPSALVEMPEPVQIALSLLNTGNYADAYGPGTGPTAHCAPLHPFLLSILFRVFGTGAGGALAMQIFGSMASSLAFALLPALSVASRLGLFSGILGGMAGALAPVNFWAQTHGSFDAPFTAAILVGLCVLLCKVWRTGQFTQSQAVTFGVVAGLGCLLNPVIIPVLAGWSIASAVRYRRQLRHVLAFFAVASVLVVSMLAPWAIRNYRTLGSLIWTRSNFGLELQVSNNDFATADLERNVRMPEFHLLHPFMGLGERSKVQALGEVAYQRSKQQDALAWISAHKRRFVLLSAERFRLFWLPHLLRPWQSIADSALTVFGLAGLALLFWKKNPFAWICLAVFATYPDVYYVIQVSGRYRFPLEPILFLLAANFFSGILWSRFTRFSHTPLGIPLETAKGHSA